MLTSQTTATRVPRSILSPPTLLVMLVAPAVKKWQDRYRLEIII